MSKSILAMIKGILTMFKGILTMAVALWVYLPCLRVYSPWPRKYAQYPMVYLLYTITSHILYANVVDIILYYWACLDVQEVNEACCAKNKFLSRKICKNQAGVLRIGLWKQRGCPANLRDFSRCSSAAIMLKKWDIVHLQWAPAARVVPPGELGRWFGNILFPSDWLDRLHQVSDACNCRHSLLNYPCPCIDTITMTITGVIWDCISPQK
jgi:hypothetical protein